MKFTENESNKMQFCDMIKFFKNVFYESIWAISKLIGLISEEMNRIKCNIDAETMNFMVKNVLFLNKPVNTPSQHMWDIYDW